MHHLLSPSGSSRWLKCPASLNIVQTETYDTEYSNLGTAAHLYCSDVLNFGEDKASVPLICSACNRHELLGCKCNPRTYKPLPEAETSRTYTDECKALIEKADKYGLEDYLVSKSIPDFGGTVDFWALTGDTLHVRDLKFGEGVPVSAEKNSQLMCYALLVIEHYNLYNVKRVVIGVSQPRVTHEIDYDTVYVVELALFKAAVQEAYENRSETFVMGNHCQFCPRLTSCPEVLKIVNMLFDMSKGYEPTLADKLHIYRHASLISSLLKSIKNELLNKAQAHDLPGFKVENTQGNRSWVGEEKDIARELAKLGYHNDAYDYIKVALLSPAQMEKKGIPKDVVNQFTQRQITGRKLIELGEGETNEQMFPAIEDESL